MEPDDLKKARLELGLTFEQMAAMLETDKQTVQRMEMQADRSTSRKPAIRMERLIEAYIDGWRPKDWPRNAPSSKGDTLKTGRRKD